VSQISRDWDSLEIVDVCFSYSSAVPVLHEQAGMQRPSSRLPAGKVLPWALLHARLSLGCQRAMPYGLDEMEDLELGQDDGDAAQYFVYIRPSASGCPLGPASNR
jgi:hypothetical protein